MMHFEGPGIVVRYDGSETRVSVERYKENNSLDVQELRTLVKVLGQALRDREKFEAQNSKDKA